MASLILRPLRVVTVIVAAGAGTAWLLVSFGAFTARNLGEDAGSPLLPLALGAAGVVALAVGAWAVYHRRAWPGVAGLVVAATLFVIWATEVSG